MALVLHWSPTGQPLHSGRFVRRDGTVVHQVQFELPFVHDRVCNPLGRLLGHGGAPIKQIRAVTKTDIVVHTNDPRFTRSNPRVTITAAAGDDFRSRSRIYRAQDWINDLVDEQDPGNMQISNLQMFYPQLENPGRFLWHPSAFIGVVISPPNMNMQQFPQVYNPRTPRGGPSPSGHAQLVQSATTGRGQANGHSPDASTALTMPQASTSRSGAGQDANGDVDRAAMATNFTHINSQDVRNGSSCRWEAKEEAPRTL